MSNTAEDQMSRALGVMICIVVAAIILATYAITHFHLWVKLGAALLLVLAVLGIRRLVGALRA